MQILDKNKDYYDFLSYQYRDKSTTYDRKPSSIINDEEIIWLVYNDKRFNSGFPTEITFFLEIGNVQYLIRYRDLKFESREGYYSYSGCKLKSCIPSIIKFETNKHFSPSAIAITPVWKKWPNTNTYRKIHSFEKDSFPREEIPLDLKMYGLFDPKSTKEIKYISNPILCHTKIPSLIEPLEVYQNLDGYFSGLYRDKTIESPMSNKEKIESKGFDFKESFRNIK